MDASPHIPFPASGSYPVRAGNAVRPLVDGAAAFGRICAAIAAARHSVWATIAFVAPEFRMPGGHGSLFDVLDRAVARGLDVRVIFWRPAAADGAPVRTFAGSAADRAMLGERGSRFRARWDRAHGGFCQHQKSWLVDAGRPSATAFVGDLNPRALADPGHDGEEQIHDLYVEVAGPAAADVHHNFVQRWNEASERAAGDGVWGHDGDDDLPFPDGVPSPRGAALVQIQRTVHAGRYRDGRAVPGGRPHDIHGGERSILDQYLLAIGAARRALYIENQAVPVPEVAAALDAALARGVDVVLLVPARPEDQVRAARRAPERRPLFDALAALGRHERFALVGIAGRDGRGGRADVYVHAKAMLVDDAWATIGSCNLHAASLLGNTEMNASFRDPAVVRALRCALLAEHLGSDTADLDDGRALALYRRIARENRRRRDAGDSDWRGLAFSLDPAAYGA
ncbi:MAG: phosphatidylserine/phosphatidylglycerophosphate/cardiolipin synthase family protein [Alphaproteobacteria bacterium]|nr:phosphatidylserine/phosphatidylglycerophosphate/cardiolipin synthase family protein [Alphaproteobacteria bacterium]